MPIQIDDPSNPSRFALFSLGFRPFFLAGTLFALLAISMWAALQNFGWQLPGAALPALQWHAHEMIYGYAMAVVAGFLLTSVRNWTGQPTATGWPLALLLLSWLIARLLPLTALPSAIILMAVFDGLFLFGMIVNIVVPIIRTAQWRHSTIVVALVLLLLSNALFYLGLTDIISDGVRMGIYSGLYLIIFLIILLGRRVIPFFIERAAVTSAPVKNWQWLDRVNVPLFFLFWFVDVFILYPLLSGVLAAALFIVHGLRLSGWYQAAIWRTPMLWILLLGYASIVLGFGLKAASVFLGISPFLAVHAFAYGGIGMVTTGMMARVALGHTARDVYSPPAAVPAIFYLLCAGTVFRVLAPLVFPALYTWWLGLAQTMWITAFLLFVWSYAGVLCGPRLDGKPG